MKLITKKFYPFLIATSLFMSTMLHSFSARADIFGGDVAVLVQILHNAVQQLMMLRQTLDIAKGDSDLLRKVNRDIESALGEIHAIQDITRETTELGKVRDPIELINRVRSIYGRIPRLGEMKSLEMSDHVVGNGFGVDNDTYMHASQIDAAGVRLQEQSRNASPGRAQQLSAQTLTIMLHSLAQIERTDATHLRVSSAALALRSSEEKNHRESFDQSYSAMVDSKASAQNNLELGSL
jgi:hypothetical protein